VSHISYNVACYDYLTVNFVMFIVTCKVYSSCKVCV